MNSEFQIKVERVRKYLASKPFRGIVLSQQHNFSWLTCGKDNGVIQGSEEGACCILLTEDIVTLLSDNIEWPRLKKEEIDDLEIDAYSFPWYEKDLEETVSHFGLVPGEVRSDSYKLGFATLPNDFKRIQFQFTSEETSRYKKLGRVTRDVIEQFARELRPGQTEREIASKVQAELMSKNIFPSVLLVGSDHRAFEFRHPIPKQKKIENYVMIVVCARRGGQVVSLTRCVHFGKIPPELRKRIRACAHVDAKLISETTSDRNVSSILEEGKKAYDEMGFPGEWKYHHQGGATGYRERDYLATSQCGEIVRINQPFAWNPSIQGSKTEDTFIAGERGQDFVTEPGPDWPVIEVEVGEGVIRRAAILQL